MGSVYARNLAQRVTNARLVAVADQKAELREQFADEFGGVQGLCQSSGPAPRSGCGRGAIVTSTSTHKQVVMDAAACGKAIFCEKPMSCRWRTRTTCLAAVEQAGVFFHMGISAPLRRRIPGGQKESGGWRHRRSRRDDLPSPAIRSARRWSSAIRK